MGAAVVGAIAYCFIRPAIGAFNWLKDGYWTSITNCSELDLFCYPSTEYLGLNKVLFWYGEQDPFTVVVPLALFIAGMFLGFKESLEQKAAALRAE
jgi:hypothetical protein